MKELFLQYLWQNALIHFHELKTTEGIAIVVLERGMWNKDAGPDFLNARLKIGNTIWAGHVEFHIKSSQWLEHKHQKDDKYKNVVLHVVLEHDIGNDIIPVPTAVIAHLFDVKYWDAYQSLVQGEDLILCHRQMKYVPSIIVEKYKETVLLERWQDKLEQLNQLLPATQNDWRGKSYMVFAKAFGFKINQYGMELLVLSTPLGVLEKHKDNLAYLEAILIGQSGLIPTDFQDEYTRRLEKDYHFFRRKYDLQSINPVVWNYAKLRPNNFPIIRIAQFAHFLFQIQFQFETLVTQERDGLNYLKSLDVKTSAYFEKHYQLSHPSSSMGTKHLGSMARQHLVINAVAPLSYWYNCTYKSNNEGLYDKAINLMMGIPKELNNKTKRWPLDNKSAFDSQSILQIINTKCTHKLCLQCSIGQYILKRLT